VDYDFPLYITFELLASQPCGDFLTAKKNLDCL